ncbi:MAG TPA: c-type cytochrome [Vicinamibacteria bacterium]|nr:c-type cytochrome [Vicinamibacteria bacterium]
MDNPRMASLAALALGALTVLCAASDVAFDTAAAAKGQVTFTRYCVSCPGPAGKGDGSISGDLRVPVPDLTEMANRNAGKYPYERVTRIVTTAEIVRGHGTVDMPAWGDAFKKTRGTDEPTVEAAIRDLNHYIWSLQNAPTT